MGHLSISLLGRLEVTLAGEPVTGFRSDKARLLLSYLAMDSSRAHRRRALAGLLWPTSDERKALRSLTTALANVRAIIADAEQDPPFLLVTRESLRFNPLSDHSLDVACLDRLSALGRASETEAVPVDALRQAVGLYRGEVLEGFSLADCPELEEWLLLQRERYRQIVLRALKGLADHGLGIGDWIAAEADARRCLALDPWDERAHRQVMVALARSGQRSAALAAFEACRLCLADELGIEPEEETTALGEAMRRGELSARPGAHGEGQEPLPAAKLVPGSHPDASAASRPLHQLGPPPADFTGREQELRSLLDAVNQGAASVVGLRGLGGVGKTTVALVLAERLADQFPDAQILVDMRGTEPEPVSAQEAMAHVIRSFYPLADLPSGETRLRDAYRSALWKKRALILLDNVRGGQHVEPLLPPATCLLVFTSRWRFAVPGAWILDLEIPPLAEAARILRIAAPRLAKSEAEELAHLCGCLPLGIRAVGRALDERPDLSAESFIAGQRSAHERLDRGLEPVHACLAQSDNLLPAKLRGRWYALSVFPTTFDRAAASSVWGLPHNSGEADESLGGLLRANLLDYDRANQRYRVHDVCRMYIAPRLGQRKAEDARARHAAHYARTLGQAYALFLEGGESTYVALGLFDRERLSIYAGQRWAASHWQTDDRAARSCCDYVDSDFTFLQMRLTPEERVRWRETGLQAAQRLGDRRAEMVCRLALGAELAFQRETSSALELLDVALSIANDIGDRRSRGLAIGLMGKAYERSGQMSRAIEGYQQFLTVSREVNDLRRERIGLNGLGTVCETMGRYAEAVAYQRRSVAIAREIGDPRGECVGLGGLGRALWGTGDFEGARSCFEEQLTLARAIGYGEPEAEALHGLGYVYRRCGQMRRARASWLQAGRYWAEARDQPEHANDFWMHCLALADLGYLAKAIDAAVRVLWIYTALGLPEAGRVRQQLAVWRGELPLSGE